MLINNTALVVTDMQKYYLCDNSSYYKYFNHISPGCLEYIIERCSKTVIPNIKKTIEFFRMHSKKIIYLRLCGKDPERKDLHRFFMETYIEGKDMGFDNIYPLEDDPQSDILDEIKPDPEDLVIDKTTFSAFTSTDIKSILLNNRVGTLVFTGLATSQCVETTARDASEHGFKIIHLIDAQADYSEVAHSSSLISSQGVCGSNLFGTDSFINEVNAYSKANS
ncbi:isochorismatase family cysteine hydrolase [Spirochaetota bacterium]